MLRNLITFVNRIHRVSIKSRCNFKNLLRRQMKRQTSENYWKRRGIYLSFLLSYLIYLYMGIISCTKHIKTVLDFLHDRCSWSSTPPLIEHCLCLHKFLVPCTNWWTWRWISSTLSSEVSLSLQIRFDFNKPWYTPWLLSRSSHFVRGSFNSILFINRVPEI